MADTQPNAVAAARKSPSQDMVTAVVRHEIKPDSKAAYEAWMKRIIPVAASFAGHRGVNVIRPPAGSDLYTVALHFDSLAEATAWLSSPERQALIEEVQPWLEASEKVETVTGLEFWFDPPPGQVQKRPPAWKQALLTLLAIFPLTTVVPWALRPVLELLPAWGNQALGHLLVAAVVVALMTWVVMPRLSRWASKWLYG